MELFRYKTAEISNTDADPWLWWLFWFLNDDFNGVEAGGHREFLSARLHSVFIFSNVRSLHIINAYFTLTFNINKLDSIRCTYFFAVLKIPINRSLQLSQWTIANSLLVLEWIKLNLKKSGNRLEGFNNQEQANVTKCLEEIGIHKSIDHGPCCMVEKLYVINFRSRICPF